MSYNLEPRSNCRSLLSALCTRAHAHNKQSKAPTLEFTAKCGRITKIHSRFELKKRGRTLLPLLRKGNTNQ